MNWIDNKTILTPTSGFLAKGYTHTINAYSGCSFSNALCGTFCYVQHNQWVTKGRPWAFYGAKQNIRGTYQREYDKIKRSKRHLPKPIRIYMSSSTDPYVSQERSLKLTRSLLEEMAKRPPDTLVIQTHGLLIYRDMDLIKQLSAICELWVSITVETDMDPVPGFPMHASSPHERINLLRKFRAAGIPTQATISPLMPIKDPNKFAQILDSACHRVIVDHFLIGDGAGGSRTRRTDFIQRLEKAGFSEWTRLEKLWEIRDILSRVLGDNRVLVSCEGFNAVGLPMCK